jgi:hypothetical protein
VEIIACNPRPIRYNKSANGRCPPDKGFRQMTLKAARAEANRHAFGTPEWESAMVVVRAIVEAQTDQAGSFVHTSVDGDVWSVLA